MSRDYGSQSQGAHFIYSPFINYQMFLSPYFMPGAEIHGQTNSTKTLLSGSPPADEAPRRRPCAGSDTSLNERVVGAVGTPREAGSQADCTEEGMLQRTPWRMGRSFPAYQPKIPLPANPEAVLPPPRICTPPSHPGPSSLSECMNCTRLSDMSERLIMLEAKVRQPGEPGPGELAAGGRGASGTCRVWPGSPSLREASRTEQPGPRGQVLLGPRRL